MGPWFGEEMQTETCIIQSAAQADGMLRSPRNGCATVLGRQEIKMLRTPHLSHIKKRGTSNCGIYETPIQLVVYLSFTFPNNTPCLLDFVKRSRELKLKVR